MFGLIRFDFMVGQCFLTEILDKVTNYLVRLGSRLPDRPRTVDQSRGLPWPHHLQFGKSFV